jgi:hypothetical protein
MKKILLTVIVATGLSASAWAADTTPAAESAAGPNHPCRAIAELCKAAGFVKGGASTGKGLLKNCMEPIMSGQAVSGVSVSADEVQACKAKKAAKAQH